MKFISLFAGVGGFDLALNRQGHECVYVNEWDKYSAQIYEKNFSKNSQPISSEFKNRKGRNGTSDKDRPDSLLPRHTQHASHRVDTRSITDVPTSEIPEHDLLVGGFPCQSFSIAGKRRGFNDTRGTLFFEIARILKDKKTKYFILENVKGLLSHDNGNTFKTIIATLDELGYDCEWQVLNSKNFGVPQNRERVFIVGHLRGTPRSKVFPFPGENENFNEKRATSEPMVIGSSQKHAKVSTDGIVPTLSSAMGLGGGQTPMIKQMNNPTHSNDRVYSKDGISPTLNTMQGGRRQPFVALTERRTEEAKKIRRETKDRDFSPRGEKILEPRGDDFANTVTIGDVKNSSLTDGARIRRLTPLECERLQGFPDNWTEGVSDTQRYKQMGNAVTVNVVEAIVRSFPSISKRYI